MHLILRSLLLLTLVSFVLGLPTPSEVGESRGSSPKPLNSAQLQNIVPPEKRQQKQNPDLKSQLEVFCTIARSIPAYGEKICKNVPGASSS
ncbi:hypothetical protein BCR43DRAFT_492683 [Syncephalastrum racemosum]|uniref:Uncharacterized protein n=1 Tax=Syncephalastrum racemosum TaxID=13706 RepID=A0A1X2H9E3_SYNRA|nr:hypothetical protein BCR43DRAFT_492683 [Syncephalastrum racemosum]